MNFGKRRTISLASLQRISREHAVMLDDRCGSVDLWTDDGVHYGRIVDVGVGGLFIDFLCPDRHRQFVPYGRIFRMPRPCELREWSSRKTCWHLQVIWRSHQHGPWTWVGAERVLSPAGCWRMDAWLVRLHNAAGRAAGALHVFPTAWIRYPSESAVRDSTAGANGGPPGEEKLRRYYGDAYAELLVGPETYVFGRVQLPAACAAVSEETQRCLMEAWLYRPDLSWPPCELLRRLDDGVTWMYVERTGMEGWQEGFRKVATRLQLALPRMLRMLDVSLAVEAAAGDGLQHLPLELLLEVFSHLDTAERTRLRPVCALWTGVVQSAPLASELVIRGRTDYALLATLVHACRSSTRRLVLHNGDLDSLLKLAGVGAHCPGIRVPTIHLPRVTCRLSVDACPHRAASTGCSVGDFTEALRRLPGEEVKVRQCRIDLLDTAGYADEELRLYCMMDTPVNIPVAHVQPTSAVLVEQVWELLEAGVAWTVGEDDKQRAADWLAEMRAIQQPLTKQQRFLLDWLCETLCALQHAVRRAGAPVYEQCSTALLEVDVEHASPLVLACLVQCAEQWEVSHDGNVEEPQDWAHNTMLKALVETRICRS